MAEDDTLQTLSELYGVDKQRLEGCIDGLAKTNGVDQKTMTEILENISLGDTNVKSMFRFLKDVFAGFHVTKSSGEVKLTSLARSFPSFSYTEEPDGTVNSMIQFSTGRGVLAIDIYVQQANYSEFDPFQDERLVSLAVGDGNTFDLPFNRDEPFRWTEISVESRFKIDEIPLLADVLDGRPANIIASEIISFGRMISKRYA